MKTSDLPFFEAEALGKARKLYIPAGLAPWMARDDAHDVVINVFLDGDACYGNVKDEDELRKLILNRIESRLKNSRRDRLTQQRKVANLAISVDEAPHGDFDEDGNEKNIETALINDHGKQAEEIRCCREPDYVYLTRYEVERMKGMDRRQCRAIMKYQTCEEARQKTGLTKRSFWDNLKKFQVRFTQCLCAYHAYLVESV